MNNYHDDSSVIDCADLSAQDTRALIFHLLYSMDCADYQTDLEFITDGYTREFAIKISNNSKPFLTTKSVVESREFLDEQYKPLLANWKFDRIGLCTKLILRMSMWELLNTDTEPVIIINEAVELSKCFAEQDAYRFINGILDEFVKLKGLIKPKPEITPPQD